MSSQMNDDIKVSMADKEETLNVDFDHLSIGNSINILNDDIMLTVFSYLSFEQLLRAAQVCVRWSEIVTQKFAYQTELKFNHFHDFPMNSAVGIIKGCGPRLQELQLAGFGAQVNDAVIEAFAPSCPNLLKIDLLSSEIGGNGARALGNFCKKLQEINLRACINLTDDGLGYLMRSLPSLKHLRVSTTPKLTGKCFRQLGPQMENLTLHDNKIISSAEISKFLLPQFKRLKELCLIGDVALSKTSFKRFCESCFNIKKLEISSSGLANHIFFEISKMAWLEELHLSSNSKLNNNTIASISRGCRNLRVLDISEPSLDVSDFSVTLIAQNCRQLVDLNISGIRKVGTLSLQKFAQVGILKSLIAYDTGLCSSGVIELVTRCPRLESMDISGCRNVGKRILQPCLNAVHLRDNNLPLKLIVGDTEIMESDVSTKDPLLIVDFHSNSNGYVDSEESDEYFDYWDSDVDYVESEQYGHGDSDDSEKYFRLWCEQEQEQEYLYGDDF